MKNVEVFLHMIITLPRWQQPDGVDSLLIQYWQTYVDAISLHEEGHRTIAIEGAKSLTRALWRIKAFDCNEIHNRVRDQYEVIRDDWRAKQNTYDRVYKPIYWPPLLETQQ